MSGSVATEARSLRELVRSNLNWVVGANLACALLSFASTIWFARTLGPGAIGEYAAIVTALQILTAFISPGFNQAVIRSPHQEDLVGAASVATAVQSVLLVAVSGIGYVVYYAQAPESALSVLGPGTLILCGIALSFFMYLLSAPFEAQINYRFLGLTRLMTLVLSIGAGMGIANGGYGLYALAVRDLSSTCLMLAAVAMYSPLKIRWHCSKEGLKQLLHFSGGVWGLNILERVTLRLDYAAVGWLLGKETLGIYFAVRNLIEGTNAFLLAPVQTVIYAALCRFNNLVGSFQKILRYAFGYLWLALVGVGVSYAFSSLSVTALFGERYRAGEPVVVGLVLYAFAVLWFELMKTFAMSRNRHHSMIAARATQLAVSLTLIYPLTLLAGLSGAGWSTGIAAVAMACVGTQLIKRVVMEEAKEKSGVVPIQLQPKESQSRTSEYRPVPWRYYAVAVLMAAVTIVVRLAMDPAVGSYYNFSPLLLGLMHVSWNYGWKAALAYFSLTLAATVYLFIPPRNAWLITTVGDWLALGWYVAFTIFIIAFMEYKRRTSLLLNRDRLSDVAEPNAKLRGVPSSRRQQDYIKAVND